MTLPCRSLPEAIADVLGGEGTPEVEAALERHVSACPACRGAHAGLAALLERARRVEVPEPPPGYWAGFLPELRRRIETARPPFALAAWLRPALLGGALAALVVASLRAPIAPELPPAATAPTGAAEVEEALGIAGALTPLEASGSFSLGALPPLPARDRCDRRAHRCLGRPLRLLRDLGLAHPGRDAGAPRRARAGAVRNLTRWRTP